jgi:hypothetical protein
MMTGLPVPAPWRVAVTVLAIGLGYGAMAMAEEIDHYEGEPSETLQQAVENFSDYNAKLEEVLALETLSMADMQQVHEYTYTLERALAKMREDMGALAITLEEVHQASEREETEALRAVARRYLEAAAPLN